MHRIVSVGFLLALAAAFGATAEPVRPERAAAAILQARGLLALEAGLPEEALARFREAERAHPEMGASLYGQGLALLRLGRAVEAADALKKCLAARIPPDVPRERILADLALARQTRQTPQTPQPTGPVAVEPPAWQASTAIDDRGAADAAVELGGEFDSNPALQSEELILARPDRPDELLRGEEGDGAARLLGHLSLYPFHRRPDSPWGLSLAAHGSFHGELDFLDLAELRGAVTWTAGRSPQGWLAGPLAAARAPFGRSRFTVLAAAGGEAVRLGGERYAESAAAAATATWQPTPRTATRADWTAVDRTNAAGPVADPRRDGLELALEVSQLAFFGRADRSLRLGIRRLDRRAERAFAARGWQGTAEVRWTFSPHWRLAAGAFAGREEYAHAESNLFALDGDPREDDTVRADLVLIWVATPERHLLLAASWAERRSSVDLGPGLPGLDYERMALSAGVRWRIR